ncbi:tape measure protein [Rhizobium herbae]|uniref:Tape measure protein N-terminal domain-containing protein n=1 Tax=Rhizobium herbae TaxID=508661 RepID=A0ABS4EVZ8_9HYPH|nr:tape measure protein [Rhizobium herbae]MBP1862140.1 hypothetical protein [Rhizobium herbae]
MKFMMIFEGVDRATKIMNKIMTAEKRTAASVKAGGKATEASSNAATRATERAAAAFNRVGSAARSAFNVVVSGAQAAGRAIVSLHQKTVALGKSGFNQITTGAGKAFRGLTVAAGIAATLMASSALAANQLVGTASKFEKFQTILETTEGSSAKAKAAMGWVTDFAVKTPYELDQVMDSFVKLRAYGLDPTNGLLQDLGDTAAAMGKPLEMAVEAIADAVTGENERLKEFGIKAAVKGNEIYYTYTVNGQKKIAKALASDPGGIQAAITGIMRERYGGAMEKLARTWDGMVSNLSDIWLKFQLAIMNAGLFDWMKGKLQGVLDTVNRLQATGELDKWAAKIGAAIQSVLEGTWTFATRAYEIFSKLAVYLQAASDYVGGWENLAMVLAGFAFAPTLIATAAGLVQIAYGLTLLATALAANPIILAIVAIAAGAALIYANWDKIGAFFSNLWASITAGIATAWAAITDFLGFDPLAMLSAGWSDLTSAISAAWDSLPSLEWSGMIPTLSWSNFVTVLEWASWLHPLRWLDLIPGFSWAAIIKTGLNWADYIASLDWAAYLPSLSWSGIVSALSWSNVLTVINWASWLHPLRWLDFIPGFSWSGIIQGGLDWASYITGLKWSDYLPSFSWPAFPAFSWPDLPAFKWPDFPALDLPEMPDIAGWIGSLGDKISVAIDGLATRATAAWAKVKSVFTFGADAEMQASVNVTDPATIRATAAATAALKTDMEAVAAIDTGPAMGRLAALEAAAKRVSDTVMSSIRQAQAFLGAVSFYPQGVALMDTLAAGIRARAAVVIEEIRKVTQLVRDHLPSSPAKTGPLSDIHRLKFTETIAGSIHAAPMVKAMRTAAAATMAAAAIAMPALSAQAGPQMPATQQAANVPPSDAARNEAARAAVARVSVQSQSAAQPAGSPIAIHFKAETKIQGGNADEVRQQWDDLMSQSGRKIAELVDEELRRRARRNV